MGALDMPGRKELVAHQTRRGLPRSVIALAGLVALVAVANGIMVWLASSGRHDLVRNDYYEAGLELDATMARMNLARAPGMDLSFRRDGNIWRVETGFASLRTAKCKARLYRPDNETEDRDLDLGASHPSSGDTGRSVWSVPSPTLRSGYWVVHLTWEKMEKPVMEESFQIHVN